MSWQRDLNTMSNALFDFTLAIPNKALCLNFPQTFPVPALPKDNPLTQEGAKLGRRLLPKDIVNQWKAILLHMPSSRPGFQRGRAPL